MSWNVLGFLRMPRPSRRRSVRRTLPGLEALEARLVPAVDVLTYHNDIASTGVNAAEVQLTPANVKVGSFGKLFATNVDGQVYAQPLVETGVTIAGGPNTTAGAAGVHDVVFVATEHDSLYAIDAGVSGGAVLWKRSFLDAGVAANNTLGATAINPVSSDDVGTTDLSPEIGITGTPVIDRASGTLYLVAKTRETVNGADHFVQRLHAISVADGTDRVTPFLIGDTSNGNDNNTPVYVYGTGDGAVTDPYNGTGRQVVQFNALREHQRGALSLVNGTVYVEWASHGDQGPYHGWVAAWDVSHLSTAGFVLTGVLNTCPNGSEAGIWQGGGRLVFEPDGSAFYFETGNGPPGHTTPTLDANGFPGDDNYYEALVKVVADPASTPTSQNSNGWGLRISDYFIPSNEVALDNADRDFGSGGPVRLPDSAGVPGHPHLLAASGKEGRIYVVDRDHMGHFDPTTDHVLNAVPDGSGGSMPPVQLSGALSTGAWYNGRLYWTSGYSGPAEAFQLGSDGTLALTSQTSASFGYLPGSAVVSANGSSNGIVWVMDRNLNRLRAYSAGTLATELWDSGQRVDGSDALGAVVKFAVPTVANGEVYVGTSAGLVVYGLTPPATAVPDPPVLSATVLSGSSVNLTWTDPTTPPNLSSGYLVEQSSDGTNFTQVTTAPAGASALAVGGLQPNSTYYFRIRGFNGLGDSDYSNVVQVTTVGEVPLLDFSGGFSGSGSALTLNGSTTLNQGLLQLTDSNSNGYEAGSAFSTNPVEVTRFDNRFTFQLSAGGNTADGFTVTFQGVGPTALGGPGGALGYGANSGTGSPGIGQSVAIKFDLYDNDGEGPDSTGLYSGGADPTGAGAIDLSASGVDLHSGDVFQVDMVYDGTLLLVTIADTQTGASAMQQYTVDIPSAVGGNSAYVGFTGATGGLVATQDVLTWVYSRYALQAPNAPSGLGATAAGPTSVQLSWTSNASNQDGYHLDRASDAGFTQNLITQTLPATGTSFTDTAAGLAPGDTWYYRLRAFNTAGESANSNPAQATIPLAPARPTDAQVIGVYATQLDLAWTDNAGGTATGYVVLRKVNDGPFTLWASLPALAAAPPSTYTWSDTGLTPGTTYEYHIEAVNISGHNDFSGTNAATLPAAPVLSATEGAGVIQLAWTAPAGALAYNIYRGTAPGQEAAAPLANGYAGTTFADDTVAAGATYYYTVVAINANISHVPPLPALGAASAEASVTLAPPRPGRPTAAQASTSSPAVTLTWPASAGATSYRVYRSTHRGGEGGTPLADHLSRTSFIDTSAAFGTRYYYKVSAVNAGGESALSSEVTATPLFAAHVHFSSGHGDPVNGYLADVGLSYGSHGQGLTFGWSQWNVANAHDRNSRISPDEMHDSFVQMPASARAWWGIAVPNGTYSVHLLVGDPISITSVYRVVIGGLLDPRTHSIVGAVKVLSGKPTLTRRWFEATVTVTVRRGVLYLSNAAGALANKIDAIDVRELPG